MSGSIRWPQSSNWHFVRFLGGLSHDRVGITTSAASDTTVVLPRRSENSCTSRPLSGSAAADDTSATAGGQQSAAASRVIATSNTTRSLRGTRAAATTATGPIAAHPFSCNNCACKNEKPTREKKYGIWAHWDQNWKPDLHLHYKQSSTSRVFRLH